MNGAQKRNCPWDVEKCNGRCAEGPADLQGGCHWFSRALCIWGGCSELPKSRLCGWVPLPWPVTCHGWLQGRGCNTGTGSFAQLGPMPSEVCSCCCQKLGFLAAGGVGALAIRAWLHSRWNHVLLDLLRPVRLGVSVPRRKSFAWTLTVFVP